MLVRDLKLEPGHDIEDYIHQSNLIEGFDKVDADRLLMKAWKRLLHVDQLDNRIVKLTQRTIVHHQDDMELPERGHYRTMNVWVGGQMGKPPAHLARLMDDWLEVDNRNPIAAHIEFEHIHPFADGNGRTGRLLMWWMQAKRGEKLIYIPKKEVQKYYAWFR